MPIYERMTIRGRGGALPTYQSQQAPYVPGQGVTARLSDSRAEIEAAGNEAKLKAVAGLGKAVKGAIDVGLQAADDYAKTKATELVTKYKTAMRQSMYGDGGILTREGESAFTANADTMKRSKELRAELLHGMDGSLVAQKFNMVIDPEEAEYSLKAQEYEGKQYRVYQDRTDTAAFNEAAESAMYGYADANTFAKGTGQALWFQEQMLRRKGYTREALERGLKESSSKIFAGGIEQALTADDLTSARRLLKQGEGSRMTAEDAAKARKAIDAKAEALEKRLEKAQKEAEAAKFEQDVVSMTAEIGKQVIAYGGDVDQQTAKAFELTADIKDEKQKAEVRKRLAADIKERDTKHKAKVTLEVAEGAKWIAQTGEDDTSLTTSDQLAAIDLLNVSDDAKAVLRQRVSDRIEGKENKAASAANLRVFRAMWDNENGMTPERARAVMLDLNLNAEDTAKAMEYEGRASEYSQARIEPLVRSVIDKNMPAEEVTKYYNALLTLIPKGDKWDDKTIKKALYDLKGVGTVNAGYDDGEEVRKSSTYRDSILSGEQDSFLPDIPAETVPLLNREVSKEQPWFTAANAETKELMRKVWYYQKYLGKTVVLDESEQRLVEEAKETYYARMGAR